MRKTLAWAAPLGVVALVTGGAAYSAAASSTPDLPDRSAAEILALAAEADVEQLSGTLRTNADLGLPELPEGLTLPGASPSDDPSPDASGEASDEPSDEAGDAASAEASPTAVLTRLLSGENTLTVAVDGPGDRFRADLDDPFAGATVVRDGDAVSFWSATEPETVTRFVAPEGIEGMADREDAADDTAGDDATEESDAPAGPEDLTPQEMADRFISEADESTEIRVDDATVVAGRDAYVVVADPRDEQTLVDRIVLAVDAETGLPLRFQVFAVDQGDPAFETGFIEIDFGAPADEVFDDAFPEDATVDEQEITGPSDIQGLEGLEGLEGFEGMDGLEGPGTDEDDAAERDGRGRDGAAGDGAAEVVGEGWSAVAVLGEPGQGLTEGDASDLSDEELPEGVDEQQLEDAQAAFGGLFQEVDGGRAISTALVSVLLADDGRVLIGSVPVERLVEVAAG